MPKTLRVYTKEQETRLKKHINSFNDLHIAIRNRYTTSYLNKLVRNTHTIYTCFSDGLWQSILSPTN